MANASAVAVKLSDCAVPTRHVTAVFGAVTLTVGGAMEKTALLTSVAGPWSHVTRINATVLPGPGDLPRQVPRRCRGIRHRTTQHLPRGAVVA